MKLNSIFFVIAVLIGSCICGCGGRKEIDYKSKGDALLDSIANGTAQQSFSETYFPVEQTKNIMGGLQEFCEFKRRKGHFINYYFEKEPAKNIDRIGLIYEFYLKCDSIRILMAFDTKGDQGVREFKIEPIEKPNVLVTRQDLRLPY